MVRTRSGKASTEAENKEAPVKQVKKSLKSPRKAKQSNTEWPYQLLTDLCVWKPTDKTVTYWACLKGLMIILLAAYSVHDQVNGIYPEYCYYQTVLAVHTVDILTNFCNELLGTAHLSTMILYTECAVNISEIFLFLDMVDGASVFWITVAIILTVNAMLLNISFIDADKLWPRVLAYAGLMMFFGLHYQAVITDCRLSTYFALVFVSMIFDLFDFPDKYINTVPICEGFIIFSRSLAVYMLITVQILLGKRDEFTNLELDIKSFLGM